MIHTEGITKIRKADVLSAEKIGCRIKLVGRCIITDGAPYIMVAPFMVSCDSALSGVNGVYNAVEVVAEPLGNVMFYGKGAGAGATASAVVGDLMQIMNLGGKGLPSFEKSNLVSDFDRFESRHYLAFDGDCEKSVKSVFGDTEFIDSPECAFITPAMTEKEIKEKTEKLEALGCKLLSDIRLL